MGALNIKNTFRKLLKDQKQLRGVSHPMVGSLGYTRCVCVCACFCGQKRKEKKMSSTGNIGKSEAVQVAEMEVLGPQIEDNMMLIIKVREGRGLYQIYNFHFSCSVTDRFNEMN